MVAANTGFAMSASSSFPSPGPVLTGVVTWFGSGLIPKAPGTWGSLAALPFAWGLWSLGGAVAVGLGAVVVFLLGWAAADLYMKRTGEHDPGRIVIDEVAGQWLTLLLVPPDWLLYGLGFALFRLFDIAKPWPIGWLDRRVGGGFGVMIDDILAGLYALAVLAALRYVLSL